MELLRQLINFWILATIACWLTLLLFYRYFDSGDFRVKLPQISRLNLNNSYIKIALVIIAAIILFFGIATELHKTIGGSGQFFQNGDEIASFVDVVVGAPVTLITSALALVLAYSALISSRQQNEISLALSTLETVKVPLEQILYDFDELPTAINKEIRHTQNEIEKLIEQSPLRDKIPFEELSRILHESSNLGILNTFCRADEHGFTSTFSEMYNRSNEDKEVRQFNNQWNAFFENKLLTLQANINPKVKSKEQIAISKIIFEINNCLPPKIQKHENGWEIYADSLQLLPDQDCFQSLRAIISLIDSISTRTRIGGNPSKTSYYEHRYNKQASVLDYGEAGYKTDFYETLSADSFKFNTPTDRLYFFDTEEGYFNLVRISGLDEFIRLISLSKRPPLIKAKRTLRTYTAVMSGLVSIIEADSDDNSLSDQTRKGMAGMISIAQLFSDDLERAYEEFTSWFDEHFTKAIGSLQVKICKTTFKAEWGVSVDPETGDEDYCIVPNFRVDDIEWEEEALIDFSDLVRLKPTSITT